MVRKLKEENGKIYEMTKFKYRCDLCKDVIESFDNTQVFCKCGNLSIGGGVSSTINTLAPKYIHLPS